MRAGHAFAISLEMLGEEMADPLGQEFRALFNEQNLGAPIDLLFALTGRLTQLLSALFGDSLRNLRKIVGVPRLGQRLLLGLLSSGDSRLCAPETHFD